MAMIGKVRRLHCREKKSVREIARITSLSRNTVRKWLKAPVEGEPKYRRGAQPTQADGVPRGAEAGAEGRRASAQAGSDARRGRCYAEIKAAATPVAIRA